MAVRMSALVGSVFPAAVERFRSLLSQGACRARFPPVAEVRRVSAISEGRFGAGHATATPSRESALCFSSRFYGILLSSDGKGIAIAMPTH